MGVKYSPYCHCEHRLRCVAISSTFVIASSSLTSVAISYYFLMSFSQFLMLFPHPLCHSRSSSCHSREGGNPSFLPALLNAFNIYTGSALLNSLLYLYRAIARLVLNITSVSAVAISYYLLSFIASLTFSPP